MRPEIILLRSFRVKNMPLDSRSYIYMSIVHTSSVVSLGFIWFHLASFGFTWLHLVSLGFIWFHPAWLRGYAVCIFQLNILEIYVINMRSLSRVQSLLPLSLLKLQYNRNFIRSVLTLYRWDSVISSIRVV
jgi:hypothetical protein